MSEVKKPKVAWLEVSGGFDEHFQRLTTQFSIHSSPDVSGAAAELPDYALKYFQSETDDPRLDENGVYILRDGSGNVKRLVLGSMDDGESENDDFDDDTEWESWRDIIDAVKSEDAEQTQTAKDT